MNSKKFDYTHLLNFTTDLITEGVSLKIKALGNSMSPYIKKGSWLTIRKDDILSLQRGDVVVFKETHMLIAHRVLKIRQTPEGPLLITKGDSCRHGDIPFGREKYIGKVIFVETKGKITDMESSFQKKINIFLAVVSPFTPAIYCAKRFLKRFFKGLQRHKP